MFWKLPCRIFHGDEYDNDDDDDDDHHHHLLVGGSLVCVALALPPPSPLALAPDTRYILTPL